MFRTATLLLLSGTALAAAACDSPSGTGTGTGTGAGALQSSVIHGDFQHDTIQGLLRDSIVVRVTDSGGRPVPDVPVSFHPLSGAPGAVSPASMATDADGRARTTWQLTTQAGTHMMEVRATANGRHVVVDTVYATARAGAAVVAMLVGDATRTLAPGQTIRVQVEGMDRYSNPIPPQDFRARWTTSSYAVATVDGDGSITGVGPGRATIQAQHSGGLMHVFAIVTGMQQTMRPAPFAPVHIHGNDGRMLGAGSGLAARGDAEWTREAGLAGHDSVLGLRAPYSASNAVWALTAEGEQRVLWRSTAPGAWNRVSAPPSFRAARLASVADTLFIGSADFAVQRREGESWTDVGTAPGAGVRTLQSLAATPGAVLAGGFVQDADAAGASTPLLLRWRPSGWTPVAVPGSLLRRRNSVRMLAAPQYGGGPAYAVLWTAGTDEASYLLRIDGDATILVPLPASMASQPIVQLGIAPDGLPCVIAGNRIGCVADDQWREHPFTDGWMPRGLYVGTGRQVYVSVSRLVNGVEEAAVAELRVF